MTFQHKLIAPEDISQIYIQGIALVKTGNPVAEQIRCCYTLKDEEKIIHIQTLFDFLDASIAPEKIEKLILSQMIT